MAEVSLHGRGLDGGAKAPHRGTAQGYRTGIPHREYRTGNTANLMARVLPFATPRPRSKTSGAPRSIWYPPKRAEQIIVETKLARQKATIEVATALCGICGLTRN